MAKDTFSVWFVRGTIVAIASITLSAFAFLHNSLQRSTEMNLKQQYMDEMFSAKISQQESHIKDIQQEIYSANITFARIKISISHIQKELENISKKINN